tara:strand:+ start:54 stop:410 length:357 start_codon:yes stop_codon:yes gene_type:complete
MKRGTASVIGVRPVRGPLLGISPLKSNPYIGFFMHHQRLDNIPVTAIKKNPYIGLLRHDIQSGANIGKQVDDYYLVDVDDCESPEESDNEGYDSCYETFMENSDFTMEVCVAVGKKLL